MLAEIEAKYIAMRVYKLSPRAEESFVLLEPNNRAKGPWSETPENNQLLLPYMQYISPRTHNKDRYFVELKATITVTEITVHAVAIEVAARAHNHIIAAFEVHLALATNVVSITITLLKLISA